MRVDIRRNWGEGVWKVSLPSFCEPNADDAGGAGRCLLPVRCPEWPNTTERKDLLISKKNRLSIISTLSVFEAQRTSHVASERVINHQI